MLPLVHAASLRTMINVTILPLNPVHLLYCCGITLAIVMPVLLESDGAFCNPSHGLVYKQSMQSQSIVYPCNDNRCTMFKLGSLPRVLVMLGSGRSCQQLQNCLRGEWSFFYLF